ncbi:DUF1902 domain-containing protein [Massilia endophytica]|uniref:DUF1902 domain-containing protein n=1 Tax=Massilia endophytica TaxID=2899220 RepID=UPI001E30ECFF|nr:DUF1902 domain-containing protein [Massilia endophytica]UGQ44790.1 DUF1902 domain-containing protein [Massilia endophytica]
MYRIGYPFWKQAAHLGIPLKIRVNVVEDEDAGVYVATSTDLRGLVCEAKTMDELVKEVNAATATLLELHLSKVPATPPITDLRFRAA